MRIESINEVKEKAQGIFHALSFSFKISLLLIDIRYVLAFRRASGPNVYGNNTCNGEKHQPQKDSIDNK